MDTVPLEILDLDIVDLAVLDILPTPLRFSRQRAAAVFRVRRQFDAVDSPKK